MVDLEHSDVRKAKKHAEVLIKILLRIIERTPSGGATQNDLKCTYQQVKTTEPHDRTIKRIVNDLNGFFLCWEDEGDFRLQTRSGQSGYVSKTEVCSPAIVSYRKEGTRRYIFTRQFSEALRPEELQASMLALSLYPQQKSLLNEQFQALMQLVGEYAFTRRSQWQKLQAEMEQHIYVSGYSAEPMLEINRCMVRILDAIRRQKLIQLDYLRSYDGHLTKGRKTAPYGMIYRLGIWYVIGLDQDVQKLRLFRLDQIKRLSIVENSIYQIPVTFSLAEYFRHSWGVWVEESEKIETVTLKVEPGIAEKFANTRYHESQTLMVDSDGSTIVTMKVAGARQMIPWLMSWGSSVEVVEPVWLREAMLVSARAMISLYAGR